MKWREKLIASGTDTHIHTDTDTFNRSVLRVKCVCVRVYAQHILMLTMKTKKKKKRRYIKKTSHWVFYFPLHGVLFVCVCQHMTICVYLIPMNTSAAVVAAALQPKKKLCYLNAGPKTLKKLELALKKLSRIFYSPAFKWIMLDLSIGSFARICIPTTTIAAHGRWT